MLRILPALLLSATPLAAEVPRVVTDIPPIHALVAQVMGDLGEPQLVVRPGSSPHHHTMRPSEARMLSEADAVIWVGPELTRWMEDPISKLAKEATVLTLMESNGAQLLPYREGAMFESHDHDHGHHDEHAAHREEAGHEDHDHEQHEDHEDHDKHGDKDHAEHDGHDDDHDRAAMDPHIWLNPDNGSYFLIQISMLLSDLDPENAATYAANARAGQEAIAAAVKDISSELVSAGDPSFIVLHDAFHYFEAHFDFEATGSVSAGDAESPGAERMQKLRIVLADSGVRCAFTEPGVGTRLLDTATEGLNVAYGVLDPLGFEQTPGPDLYVNTLRAMSRDMLNCLRQ